MISSVIPSLKYSFSGSALMLARGRTAIALGRGGDFCASGGVARGLVILSSECLRASRKSEAFKKRSAGVRARARVTVSSTVSGTSRTVRTFGIGETKRFEMMI